VAKVVLTKKPEQHPIRAGGIVSTMNVISEANELLKIGEPGRRVEKSKLRVTD